MFRKGLAYSFPIVLAYLPVAFTFAMVAKNLGFSSLETLLASILIFAGASQFALITLSGKSIFTAILVPLLLNLRHIVYSSIISKSYRLRMPYISAFGLTDEVFATSVNLKENERFLIGLEVGAYSAWVGGTAIGVFAGSAFLLDDRISSALVFSLSALFLVLLLPNLKERHLRAAFGGGVVALAFHLVNLSSLGIIVAAIAGPLLAGWRND